MWETSAMLLWTGSARVFRYSRIPNRAPPAQMASPSNKIVRPVRLPPIKDGASSEGNLMSPLAGETVAPGAKTSQTNSIKIPPIRRSDFVTYNAM